MAHKKIYDISLEISPGMIAYPGDPPFTTEEVAAISRGDSCNLSKWIMGSHLGTHVDAPKHFFDNGTAVDLMGFEYFMGKARLFEIGSQEAVTEQELKGLKIQSGDIVLLKTRNSSLLMHKEFDPHFTSISTEAAGYLADIGIKTLGFDYLSIDSFGSETNSAHLLLLKRGVAIIEGLNLAAVAPGQYQLVALPLRIKNGNGSPVRAVLIEEID